MAHSDEGEWRPLMDKLRQLGHKPEVHFQLQWLDDSCVHECTIDVPDVGEFKGNSKIDRMTAYDEAAKKLKMFIEDNLGPEFIAGQKVVNGSQTKPPSESKSTRRRVQKKSASAKPMSSEPSGSDTQKPTTGLLAACASQMVELVNMFNSGIRQLLFQETLLTL